MRKRKWWIISSVVVFLGVCVAISQLENLRPYRFLAGAKIKDYYVGAETANIQLESDERIADLTVLADAELLPGGWTKRWYRKPQNCVYSRPIPGMRSGDSISLSAGGGITFVHVMRNATLSDRITAWLYKRKNR